MKRAMPILISVLGLVLAGHTYAEKYIGDGAWTVVEYMKGTILVVAVEIYREDPDKGARPTFMVNYGDKEGCYVSLGLTMLAKDIPRQQNRKEILGMLRGAMEKSEFIADNEVLTIKDTRVQALDMGSLIYARKLIDSDSLAAFMLAKRGAIRIKNSDAIIKFNMLGFEKSINKIVGAHCQ